MKYQDKVETCERCSAQAESYSHGEKARSKLEVHQCKEEPEEDARTVGTQGVHWVAGLDNQAVTDTDLCCSF